ncbi:hypothetical protein AW736_13215 [Termitidicoccus mucosus]|uniref:Sialidase domain-containing protein n=1 Tax=Termitidicoccus mucosus TaxID=1184151 RepID=A0A178IHI8_9BACT|nr:hypothetical protein AW736_13215 [Opitutaceae bacterium TSB47]
MLSVAAPASANSANGAREISLAEALELALEPPVFNTNPGPEYSDKARNYGMVIGMDRTPKGRIWAVWVAGGDSEDGYFVAATSDDNGRTWSKPRLVIDPVEAANGLKRRTLVGVPWTDPLGRLWLFFDQSMGYFDGRGGSWAAICENPDSDNPVWSAPRRIWHGATLNKPVVLSNGEWLLPVSLWTRDWIRSEMKVKPETEKFPGFSELFHDLDDMRMAHWFASSDQGKTWTRRGGVAPEGRRFDEHTLVELKDGRLWMLSRTQDGLVEAFSSDFGETWTEPQPSPVKHVIKGARVFFRRLASGGILLVKLGKIGEQLEKRGQLMAFVSYDEGGTWSKGLMLDERANVTYPDGFQSPDGDIYIIYDRQRAAEREILYARFTEEDLRQGAFKSKQSRAKQLVNKALGPAKKKK